MKLQRVSWYCAFDVCKLFRMCTVASAHPEYCQVSRQASTLQKLKWSGVAQYTVVAFTGWS